MKLTTLQISFPILKISSMVSQAISRKPTLFEKAILELTNRFNQDEVYCEYTLESVFSEILKVPEADNFVQPTLDQLINFSIVDCKSSHHSLSDVQIKDLTLTPNGKRLLERGVMPVFKEKNRVEHYYDPIQDRLFATDELKKLTAKAKGKPLELDTEGLFPDYLIRNELQTQSDTESTSRDDVQEIIPAGTETMWKTVEGEIDISDEGQFSLNFADPFYNDYFSQFNSAWLYEHYLSELFADTLTENATKNIRPGAIHEIADNLKDIFPACDLDLKIKLSAETTHFLQYHPFLKRQLKIKPKTLLVVFDYPSKKKDHFEWDAKKNGALVLLKDKFPIEHCQYLNADKENFFISPFEIKINTELFTVPLGYCLKKSSRELKVKQLFKLLEKKIDESGDVQQQLIKLFWRSSEDVLRLIEKMTS